MREVMRKISLEHFVHLWVRESRIHVDIDRVEGDEWIVSRGHRLKWRYKRFWSLGEAVDSLNEIESKYFNKALSPLEVLAAQCRGEGF